MGVGFQESGTSINLPSKFKTFSKILSIYVIPQCNDQVLLCEIFQKVLLFSIVQ